MRKTDNELTNSVIMTRKTKWSKKKKENFPFYASLSSTQCRRRKMVLWEYKRNGEGDENIEISVLPLPVIRESHVLNLGWIHPCLCSLYDFVRPVAVAMKTLRPKLTLLLMKTMRNWKRLVGLE